MSGCDVLRHQTPGMLVVTDARLVAVADGAELDISLDCRLNGPMSDALEHGIPITLRIELSVDAQPRAMQQDREIELRYFPLSRRYQLRDLDQGSERSFSAYGALVDSLAALRLPVGIAFATLAPGTRASVVVSLDRTALPGPLRLPALIEPAWRLSAPEYTWTVAAG
ncbi:MAG: DUF4390 domain-containing protein, partial [Dokdonella sp.]